MSKIRKLVGKMLRRPPEMRFDEVKIILERFGWKVFKVRGDHFNFKKEQEFLIVIAKKGRQVNRTYLKRIISRLNLEVWYEEHR